MAEKRLKETIGARVHPIKKNKLKGYCENHGTTIQALIEDYVNNLLELSEEDVKVMSDGRNKAARARRRNSYGGLTNEE